MAGLSAFLKTQADRLGKAPRAVESDLVVLRSMGAAPREQGRRRGCTPGPDLLAKVLLAILGATTRRSMSESLVLPMLRPSDSPRCPLTGATGLLGAVVALLADPDTTERRVLDLGVLRGQRKAYIRYRLDDGADIGMSRFCWGGHRGAHDEALPDAFEVGVLSGRALAGIGRDRIAAERAEQERMGKK